MNAGHGVCRLATALALGVLVVFGLPASVPAGASSQLQPARPGTRAMWLWDDAAPAEVMDWALARGVTEVFVYIPDNGPDSAQLVRLRELKTMADPAGITLSALGGQPEWTTNHAAALTWRSAVAATGLFARHHLDVEPHLLPAWTTARSATATAYLSLLSKLARASGAVPVEADVAFWYGQIRLGGKNLATEVLRRVSAVTVMSYRDRGVGPDSIWSISQDWLARGASAGKRVRLAAETDATPDCPACTFAEEGAVALDTALAEVDQAAQTAAVFNGIAVHHYRSWRALSAGMAIRQG